MSPKTEYTPEQLAAAKTVVAAIKSSSEYLKALKTLNDLDQTRHLCYTAARILAAEIELLHVKLAHSKAEESRLYKVGTDQWSEFRAKEQAYIDCIKKLESALKAHHDAIDAQPWASDEPVGVLLNKVTARLTQAEARVKELESENAKLREDGERLDWVQSDTVRVGDVLGYFMSCEDVDIRKAIDAARAQKGGAS